MNQIFINKIKIWIFLSLLILLAFFLGFFINDMELDSKFIMVITILTIFIILSYILVERFHYNIRKLLYNEKTLNSNFKLKQNNFENNREFKHNNKEFPLLLHNGKEYSFSKKFTILFILGAPLLSTLIYLWLLMELNYWINEITSINTVYFLNLIFNLNAVVIFPPEWGGNPAIFVPNSTWTTVIINRCTAAPFFSIITGSILLIPQSNTSGNKKDLYWRKTKVLIFSNLCLYFLNILRLIALCYLTSIGIPHNKIHQILLFFTSIFGVLIFVFITFKLSPELYLSIYYLFLTEKRKKQN